MIDDVPRIEAEEAHRRVASGRALLVCAYENEAKCEPIRLEGSITMRELRQRFSSLLADTELIFYCA
jgi:hypothetical protein